MINFGENAFDDDNSPSDKEFATINSTAAKGDVQKLAKELRDGGKLSPLVAGVYCLVVSNAKRLHDFLVEAEGLPERIAKLKRDRDFAERSAVNTGDEKLYAKSQELTAEVVRLEAQESLVSSASQHLMGLRRTFPRLLAQSPVVRDGRPSHWPPACFPLPPEVHNELNRLGLPTENTIHGEFRLTAVHEAGPRKVIKVADTFRS